MEETFSSSTSSSLLNIRRWTELTSKIRPGESRPDWKTSVTSTSCSSYSSNSKSSSNNNSLLTLTSSSTPIQYVTQLSSSFGLFTLLVTDTTTATSNDNENDRTEHGGGGGEATTTATSSSSSSSSSTIVDVVVKLRDGWSITQISDIISILKKLQRGEYGDTSSNNKSKNGTSVGTEGMSEDLNDSEYYAITTTFVDNFFRITVLGYLERMRAQSVKDICSPVCLHAMEIKIEWIEHSNDGVERTLSEPCGFVGTNIVYKVESTNNDVHCKSKEGENNVPLENGAVDMRQYSSSFYHPSNMGSTICKPVAEDPISCTRNSITSSTHGEESTVGTTASQWRGAKDSTRFPKFVKFLLHTFGGYDTLSQHPILDVAGGAGGLGFELSVRYGINCVVVDTKPVKYNSKQLRHLAFRQQCVAQLQDHNGRSPLARNLMNRFQVSDGAAVAALNGGTDLHQCKTLFDSQDIMSHCHERRHAASTTLEEDDHHDDDHDRRRLYNMLQDRKCSIIVGLHPDQATDHIIDVGLALQIPWAVVPCCVFPNLFRGRTTRVGTPVKTYDDLCDYILGKDPNGRILQTTLPFRGRNKVFYWIPASSTATAIN